MKSSTKSDIKSEKYKVIGLLIIIIAAVYILSDFMQWYMNRERFILDINQMPLYRRILTDLYLLLFGCGGYLLVKENPKSWNLIIISMTSTIPSFLIIPLVWNISFYTNWIEDLPFLLWYLFSLIIIIVFVVNRKDFGINTWIGKLSVILLINFVIRVLHEIIMYKTTI